MTSGDREDLKKMEKFATQCDRPINSWKELAEADFMQ